MLIGCTTTTYTYYEHLYISRENETHIEIDVIKSGSLKTFTFPYIFST